MGHAHDHHHDHGDLKQVSPHVFVWGIGLNLAFVAIEGVYGWLADSMALIADAGHNLSDVLGLVLAWGAILLAARRPTPRRTYGWRRATILASLGSAVLLLVALGAIVWEAFARLRAPQPVDGKTVLIVAAIGVVINTVTALLLIRGQHDLNVRGAYLHMVADAAVSLGVVVSGVLILWTGWSWVDPAISLVVAAVILAGTWGLLRDAMHLSLDGVPREIDPGAVAAHLRALPGVQALHDLHIWAMSTTENALTVHLTMPEPPVDDRFLGRVCHELRERFGIAHATVQIERGSCEHACAQVLPGSAC